MNFKNINYDKWIKVNAVLFVILATALALVSFSGCKGPTGEMGPQGFTGASCSVRQLENGAIITCGDQSAVILNGANATLPAGTYTISEIVNPCAVQGDFDEVLLKLSNGKIIGHYADGAKQFLTVLVPRSYDTTDGYHCRFTVNSDNSVTW